VTVTVLPAIVSEPVRELVELFSLTEKATVPLAEPELPLVTVIQVTLLEAVHPHEQLPVTPTAPVPEFHGIETVDVESEYAHEVAACVTVTVFPPAVSVAERELVADGFAVAEKATVPDPLPDAPAVIVSQLALLTAVQAQLEVVLTPTDPVLDPDPRETAVVETL